MPDPDEQTKRTEALREKIEGIEAEMADMEEGREDLYEFAVHVDQLANTKRGRFIKVHFEGGTYLDLVPKGSVALGIGLKPVDKKGKADWKFTRLDINKIWDEFWESA